MGAVGCTSTAMKLLVMMTLLCVSSVYGATDAAVKSWSDAISGAIDDLVQNAMQVNIKQQTINDQPYTEIHVDGSVSAASVAAQLARLFNDMQRLPSNIALEVESLVPTTTTSTSYDFYPTDTSYELFSEETELDENKFFTTVSYPASAVKSATLNVVASDQNFDVAVTDQLLPTFQAGVAASTSFQYFGSASGVLRVYPAHEWETDGSGGYMDYDPRLSPWYARTVSGAKNVVLLLDNAATSGAELSRLQLAAHSVLSTLSMDDYVTVIRFDGDSSATVVGADCFVHESEGLVLARGTGINIQMMKDAVSAMTGGARAGGVDAAFGLAFTAMQNSATSNVGVSGSCESMVLLLSAGSSSGNADSIASANTVDARVFSYSIAENGGNSKFLRDVSCYNRGIFTRATTDDDAAAVGLYYTYVLQDDGVAWFTYGGGLRPDLLATAGDDSGPISHYTVARAAWDRTTSPPTLLGVAAADFNMYPLKNAMDSRRFQQSFPMLVNNEGDTLYHPLQTVYKKLHLYDVGRDVSNYENFPSWDMLVRPGLLSGGVGEATLTVDRVIEKGDAAFEGIDTETLETTYFWQKVPDLPFFIAFVYTAKDLVQRAQLPTREGNDYMLWREIGFLNHDSLKDTVPPVVYDYSNPEIVDLFNGQTPAFYNDGNCDSWTNCMEDQYCRDNGLTCTGDCVCHPHRWSVGLVSTTFPTTSFSPQCFKDSKAAFEYVWDDASTGAMQRFINREKGATNPEPIVKDGCLLDGQIAAKFATNVAEAVHVGNHTKTVWTYLGTSTGVMAVYPGVSFGNAFDPTRRPWYSRSIAYKGVYQHIVSTPYMDAGGSGLIITICEAAWQEQVVDKSADNYLEIIDDRVFGVNGWDMLYPALNDFASEKTADLEGGCSVKDVYTHLTTDAEPLCFMMDPSGLLLTHPDFLVSADEAESFNDQIVGGDVGAWPINNVFIGKKEPSIARAMVDAGLLVQMTRVVNEDSTKLLSWFQVDLSAIPASGVIGGDLPDDGCLEAGGTWQVSLVALSNVFLVVADGYQRRADMSGCTAYEAEAVEDIPFDTCEFTTMAVDRAKGQLECPTYDKPSTVEYEAFRLDYAQCAEVQYVESDEGVGMIATALSIVGIICTVILMSAIVAYRQRYVLRASSPFFCILMCVGALFGFALELTMIGEPTDGMCVARNWAAGFALVFLYSPLLAKTWRLHKLFNNKALKKIKIRNSELLMSVFSVAGVQIALLLMWTALEPPKVTMKPDDVDPLLSTLECDSKNFATWFWIQMGFTAVMVLFGVFLCYSTRNLAGEFNESSQIAVSIYNMFFMGCIIVPMVYGLDVDYKARFVLVTVGIIAVCSVTLMVLFVPKFMMLNKTKTDFTTSATSTGGGGTVNSTVVVVAEKGSDVVNQ